MSRLVHRAVLVATAVAVFAAAPVDAAIRYASPTGTGPAASCPAIDPCSIFTAANATYTNDGDEVILAPGDYNTGAVMLNIVDGVDVHGPGLPSRARIYTTASTGVYLGNAGAKLRNVEIIHTTGIINAVSINSGTLERAIVRSQDGAACVIDNATIRDSICASGRDGTAGVSINESSGTYSSVLRNVTAIGLGASSSYGIFAGASPSTTVSIDAKSVIARGLTKDVWASASGVGSSSTVTLDHSNYSTVQTSGASASVTSTAVNNNQTAAPTFVNAAAGDYHQATGSPTIDAGATDGSSGATDVDAETRTLGSAVDIGGDEYVATPPAAPVITSPAGGDVMADTTPAIVGTGAASSTIAVFANGSPVGTTTANSSGDWNLDISPALADGLYSITATAANFNNIVSGSSAATGLSVDTTAPSLSISSPAGGTTINDNTPTLKLALTEVNPGVSECRVDGGAWTACVSGGSLAVLADGKHTLEVRHTDLAGNVGTASTSFSIDATAPQTKIGKHPKLASGKRTAKFTFTSNDPSATFSCKLDKRAYAPCKSPYAMRVKAGKHVLLVRATDAVGNRDATPAKFRWRVLPG